MVRIVEEKPDPSVVKQVVCGNCGRKLEYVPADKQRGTTSDYYYNFITCPGCKHKVPV